MKKLCIVLLALSSFILASCGGTPASQDAVPVSTDLPAEQAVVEEVLSPEAQAAYDAEQAIAQEAEAQLAEELEGVELTSVASGSFVGIAPGHNADGAVTISENGDNLVIDLDSSFVSDEGPDLYVILTQEQTLTGADPVQLDTSKIIRVAPLVSLTGEQKYEISKADFESHGYAVAIWCNEFNVVFGAATLN